MTLIHSVLLGIVEGITEFLPISSTAHLEISARILGIASSDFFKSFEIIIQLGAILAIVVLYAQTLSTSLTIWKKIIAAFLPTGVIGFVLYKIIKDYLLGNETLIIWTLGIGGIILIIFELVYSREEASLQTTMKELEAMSYKKAVMIGLAQSIAVVPGVSRAAATIMAGRVLGLSRKAIVEFSFLLAIPTMLAAASYDLTKNALSFSSFELLLLAVGFVTAFISALVAVRFLLRYIQTHTFIMFGVYRIILAIALILLYVR
ncbi:MAG: undecaprenyl-diphosphatase UppP [bacterium]|nr:undecaprenyl-diphosphatase UppP [bacterium]